MGLKVYINPTPEVTGDNNGIGRVIRAQYAYLRDYGIDLMNDARHAEVIASHITGDGLPRTDVHHVHGLYWSGDHGSGSYVKWHHNANARIAATARQARLITVPSEWVSEVFLRDMRIDPVIIGHGISFDEWTVAESRGYVLWNKNRTGDVCDPTPAHMLADRGIPVMSTFPLRGKAKPAAMKVTGTLPWETMKELVRHADVYLGTTKETYGIGVLEAMAAGVLILGYRHGGTASMVEHKVTGFLARPGSFEELLEGYDYIIAHRAEMSAAAREYASGRDWKNVIGEYAQVYQYVADQMTSEPTGVAVVITCYNYDQFVGEAIDSVIEQTYKVDEIVVVDDGSSDQSYARIQERAERYHGRIKVIRQKNQGVAAARNNGIAASSQPFIICLDADDRLAPRNVELLRKAMLSNRALGVAYGGLAVIRENGVLTPNAWPIDFNWEIQTKPTVPPSNCIPCSAMFRRTMWKRCGGYRQVYAPAEDTEFFTHGLSLGFEAERVTEEPLFHYRLHGPSASRTKTYKAIDGWHPWMRDKQYPFAAPAASAPVVRSYSEPVVSVITPVGEGHEKFLGPALDSLLGQEFRDWEVIVADDTLNGIAPETLEQYPFVVYTRVDNAPRGAGAARNIALNLARARLVLFLDADDFLFPAALQRMLEAIVAAEGKRYIFTQYVNLMPDGSFKDVDDEHRPRDHDQHDWFKRGQHAVVTLMPTSWVKAVGGFDEALPGWEDWDFFLKLVTQGYCGRLLNEVMFGYRVYSGERRERSLTKKHELWDLFNQRYGKYMEEAMPNCGTCGDGGEVIIETKRRLGVLPPAPEQVSSDATIDARPTKVRMRYIGQNVGAITFFGKHREYRGGLDPLEKFKDVDPEDVDTLLASGKWEIVRAAPPPPPMPSPTQPKAESAPPAAAIAVPEQTEMTAAEILHDMDGVVSGGATPVASIPVVEDDDPDNTPLLELPPLDGGVPDAAEAETVLENAEVLDKEPAEEPAEPAKPSVPVEYKFKTRGKRGKRAPKVTETEPEDEA